MVVADPSSYATSFYPTFVFDPPAQTPNARGIYQHVDWVQDGGPPRFLLDDGLQIRPVNYGGRGAVTTWEHGWCAPGEDFSPGDEKTGTRPSLDDLEKFFGATVYGYDMTHCARPSAEAQADVRARARRAFDIYEQIDVETAFAVVGKAATTDFEVLASDLQYAVAALESAISKTGLPGFIHLSPLYATYLAQAQMIYRDGDSFKTILGNTFVFGGGYVDELPTTLLATSQVYGWRGDVLENEYLDHQHNHFIAVAERSVLLGYEQFIGRADIT